MNKRSAALILYFVFVLVPIYWMINMSLKTNEEITGAFSLVYFLVILLFSYVFYTVLTREANP